MSKVYILQEVMRRHPETGRTTPAHDFGPAGVYGELVFVIDAESRPSIVGRTLVNQIKEVLRDYTEDDYILPVGDPSLMTIAGAVVSKISKKFKILQWDRRSRAYIEMEVSNV